MPYFSRSCAEHRVELRPVPAVSYRVRFSKHALTIFVGTSPLCFLRWTISVDVFDPRDCFACSLKLFGSGLLDVISKFAGWLTAVAWRWSSSFREVTRKFTCSGRLVFSLAHWTEGGQPASLPALPQDGVVFHFEFGWFFCPAAFRRAAVEVQSR